MSKKKAKAAQVAKVQEYYVVKLTAGSDASFNVRDNDTKKLVRLCISDKPQKVESSVFEAFLDNKFFSDNILDKTVEVLERPSSTFDEVKI